MKKILAIIAIAFAAATHTSAQEFYMKAGLGYGFPQTGQTMDGTGALYNGTITNNNSGTESYSMKNASMGTGLKGVLGAGYMFNKFVGVELDAALSLVNKKYTFTDNNFNSGGDTGVLSYTNQANTNVFLMPAIVIQNGGAKWNVYARVGLALPVYAQTIQHQIFTNYFSSAGAVETDDYEWKEKYNFSLGFTGAVGVDYKFNDNASIFVEANMLSMSLYLKEADLTQIDVDGQSYPLSQLPAGDPQKIKYSKKVTVDPNDQSNQPTFAVPYSNVGLTVGVKFVLAHHNGTKHHDELRRRSSRFN